MLKSQKELMVTGRLAKKLGGMKQAMRLVLWFIFFAFAADEIRATIQHRLEPFLFVGLYGWEIFSVIIYAVVYCFAGALISSRALLTHNALWLSLLLGLTSPMHSIAIGSLTPMFYSDHGPRWYDVLGWANSYSPPLACLVGGAVYSFVNARRVTSPEVD